MHKTGEAIGGTFGVSDPDTSGLVAPDALPTAELRINNVISAAVVTVTATATTGKYTWSVTLPTIADGTVLEIWVLAVVDSVTAGGVVWSGLGVTKRPADVYALAAAQRVIDQTTTPWQLVLKDRVTGAELLRYDLKDEDGDDIASIATFVAEQVTPP